MIFTYESYFQLLNQFRKNGYVMKRFFDFHDSFQPEVILRHDVDVSLRAAAEFSEAESKEGIHSTYFILVSSDIYNPCSCENRKIIREIRKAGHEIGLHFDMSAYSGDTLISELEDEIALEKNVLEGILDEEIESISWHMPYKKLLGKDFSFLNDLYLRNAYGGMFFNNSKYLSDSMRRWREDPEQFIDSGRYKRIQLLTHPVWYSKGKEETAYGSLLREYSSKKDRIKHELNKVYPGFANHSDLSEV